VPELRAAGESKTAVGATALKAATVEARVSAAQVAMLEVTVEAKALELAVGATVYLVEAELLAWRMAMNAQFWEETHFAAQVSFKVEVNFSV
jgi:hypothetical protein